MALYKSSIGFQSNLALLKDSFYDPQFLAQITDPEALGKLRSDPHFALVRWTPLQEEIWKKCGAHCVYAEEGDYPWGIPAGSRERDAAICLCTQTGCKNFGKCRPDFITDAPAENPLPERLEPTEEPATGAAMDAGDAGEPVALAPMMEEIPAVSALEESAEKLPGVAQSDEADPSDPFPEKDDGLPISGEAARPSQIPDNQNHPGGEEIPAEPEATCPPGSVGINSFAEFVTVGQDVVIRLPVSARVLVDSPPGTGKTWTLIERIKYLVNVEEISPKTILVLTFSRAAAAVIKTRMAGERANRDFAEMPTGTFHSFAFSLLNQYREEHPDLSPAGMDYDGGIVAATKLLSSCPPASLLAPCEHLIIDEIQDLSGIRASFVMALLLNLPRDCGVTLLGDACQAIYDWDNGTDPGPFSTDLYKWLKSRAPRISHYFTFARDYRKVGDCMPDTDGFRQAILAGDRTAIDREFAALRKRFPPQEGGIARMVNAYPQNETVGILTRSNAMALAISTQLSMANILHANLLEREKDAYANWIVDILGEWPNLTIHRDDFVAKFMELYDRCENEKMANACWVALVGRQRGGSREIRDLLFSLPLRHDPLLWRSAGRPTPSLYVGNVFRAKGREYDNVILVDDLFEERQDRPDTGDEDRVRYVAWTRARKGVETAARPSAAGYLRKDERCDSRIFKGGRVRGSGFRPKYIANFEVGLPGDILPTSFATVRGGQEAIKKYAIPGHELSLFKKPGANGQLPVYKVRIGSEETGAIVGVTSREFGESLMRSLLAIYGTEGNSVNYRAYPGMMKDIYISAITSCISPWKSGLAGARQFEDMALWRGFSCRGLASTVRDSY